MKYRIVQFDNGQYAVQSRFMWVWWFVRSAMTGEICLYSSLNQAKLAVVTWKSEVLGRYEVVP